MVENFQFTDICDMLYRDGFVHLKTFINQTEINSAVRAINFEIGQGISKEDIEKMRINLIPFGTKRLLQSNSILNLFYKTKTVKLVEQLYGDHNIYLPESGVQVALRFPQDVDDNTISYFPWHLDNIEQHGVKGFGLLVGVFLNDTPEPDSGNFTVFPGAHTVLQNYFKQPGCITSLYRHKNGKMMLPNIKIGDQCQILAKAGDVVICHHQLPHRAAPNLSPNIRMAVFFRIYHKHLPFEHPTDCQLRHFSMRNLWSIGWSGMKSILSDKKVLVDLNAPTLCNCATKYDHADINVILSNLDLSLSWIQGSKCPGTLEFWTATRSIVIDALDKNGVILDIGCANGFLLACIVRWSQEKSLTLTPYGIECEPSVLQCKCLFPQFYEAGHFIHIDLNSYLLSPSSEAPAFPSQFDFIYWNVWTDGCDLETHNQQFWMWKLFTMLSPGGKLLLALYGTQEQNQKKLKNIKAIAFSKFLNVDDSNITIFKAHDHPHMIVSISLHTN